MSLGPPFLPTPKRGHHFCPSPTLPASLPGLTHSHDSWNRRPLKPSLESLTQVPLPQGHPVCHIPYLLLSSVPHLLGVAPVSQGPGASCLAAFFIPPHIRSQSSPEQSRVDSLCPLSPSPGSRLRPPASLIWTLSLLPGLPASQPPGCPHTARPMRVLSPGLTCCALHGLHPLSWTRSSPQHPLGGPRAWGLAGTHPHPSSPGQ